MLLSFPEEISSICAGVVISAFFGKEEIYTIENRICVANLTSEILNDKLSKWRAERTRSSHSTYWVNEDGVTWKTFWRKEIKFLGTWPIDMLQQELCFKDLAQY